MQRGVEDEERGVRAGRNEADALDERSKTLKPSPWRLFEAVERFLKMADVVWKGGVRETKRLATVDSLIERAMQNAFLTSSWWIGHEEETTRLRTTRIVLGLTTGEKVSP